MAAAKKLTYTAAEIQAIMKKDASGQKLTPRQKKILALHLRKMAAANKAAQASMTGAKKSAKRKAKKPAKKPAKKAAKKPAKKAAKKPAKKAAKKPAKKAAKRKAKKVAYVDRVTGKGRPIAHIQRREGCLYYVDKMGVVREKHLRNQVCR